MSALNVDFPDRDLQEIREIAQERGMTMKAFVRSATADAIAHHRARKEAAEVFRRTFDASAPAEAIAEPGADDGPASGGADRAP
ncbi:hypothetical protein I5Q34_24100 [Streptomyces sp. AV19]|uniref:hypothetical protein n=1 Tax=Streptomyces sp. AV19 TaxID=2793068 RepID=UPI0018FE3A74|nr:hypothetical protein [Streptomyces sp. AV19]MBH1937315.1 hypothetical protein [Streptomyces sp. AV19]MDG4536793.1 hypothetical protein [Streptomyces sp. AV19]